MQRLTLDHLRRARVRLVLVGGLPGSGKTTLAAGLAAATGWTVLRSDQIRTKVGDPAIDSSPGQVPGYREGRYGPAATRAVYEELLSQAGHQLGMGQSVVLDASWTDESWRDAARELSDRTYSDLGEFRCRAAPEVAADRIARRLKDRTDLSEATPEIARAMSRSADSWPSAISIDTEALTPDEAVTKVVVAVSPERGHIDRSVT